MLEFEPQAGYQDIDAMMGWTTSTDMRQELSLSFPDMESAVAYAKEAGISYRVIPDVPKKPKKTFRSYADNFTKKKV